jgi:hypothetical protein
MVVGSFAVTAKLAGVAKTGSYLQIVYLCLLLERAVYRTA